MSVGYAEQALNKNLYTVYHLTHYDRETDERLEMTDEQLASHLRHLLDESPELLNEMKLLSAIFVEALGDAEVAHLYKELNRVLDFRNTTERERKARRKKKGELQFAITMAFGKAAHRLMRKEMKLRGKFGTVDALLISTGFEKDVSIQDSPLTRIK